MKFNKLVRDRIPEIINNNGSRTVTHIADEKEYDEALARKLQEEVNEFLEKPCAEEFADILEVLHAICVLKNVDVKNLDEIRQKKIDERGGFEDRIILESTD